MVRHHFWILTLLSVMILGNTQVSSQDVQGHPLRDLVIFGEQRYGMWAGSGESLTLQVEDSYGNGILPIDSEMMYQGLPSLKVEVTGECW